MISKKLISNDFDKLFLDVEKETIEKEEKRYYLWVEWYSNWIDFFKWFDILTDFNQFDSILFNRLFELNKHLLWICKCVHSGTYHTAIRELRFIFESFVQAYYIDKEHPNSKLECKLEIIKEIDKLIGGTLINKTNLENKEKLRELYSKLSKYIHASYEEVQEMGNNHNKLISAYDKELFNKCYIFTNKVMDAIIFLLMSFEKRMIKKIKEDKLMMEFLKETNCELSLNLITLNY